MIKKQIKATNKSVESAGLPSDYMGAIMEYIRNGFDAGASILKINYEADNLGGLKYFSIIDDGIGIPFEQIDLSFGGFLDSPKKYRKTVLTHGSKGKGRFAFQKLGNGVRWITRYKESEGVIKEYEIYIGNAEKKDYEYSDSPKISKGNVGTEVVILNPIITVGQLQTNEFIDTLKREFGWLLYLQQHKGAKIEINGTTLDYKTLFLKEPKECNIIGKAKDENGKEFTHNFKSTIIVWKDKISEYSSFYLLNTSRCIVNEKATSFNNKKDEFYHSVYVESDLFNNEFVNLTNSNISNLFTGKVEDKIFQDYLNKIHKEIEKERKEFLRGNQDKIIDRFNKEGVLPKFGEDIESIQKKVQFESFVKEVYVITPRLFESLNEPQKKTILGMMNTLIDSEKKEDLIYIINEIEKLTDEELQKLRKIIESSSLLSVISTCELIQKRYKVVEGLKKLVFDLTKFTTERDTIQKIIEENYWLICEGFERLTADENFKTLYSKRLEAIGELKYETSDGSLKRPDIFLTNYRFNTDPADTTSERKECVIIELKRPSQDIGRIQYNQIEGYMETIMNLPENNTSLVDWKFYIIGKKLDNILIKKRQESANRGDELFLVEKVGNYKIYALTWADLFSAFETKHSYLFKKMNINREEILKQIETKQIGKKATLEITGKVLEE